MRYLLPVILLVCTSASAQEKPSTKVTTPWQAGAASAVITPRTMMWMAGYASRTKPAEGVAMDLYAKALVLDDTSNPPLALITLDLVSVPRSVRLAAAERIHKTHGIPPERLVINASHTHCGPEMRIWRTSKTDNAEQREREAKEYCEFLVNTLEELVGQALKTRTAATVDYTHARCGFAMNRRRPTPKGFQNAPWPEGPVDHRVPVLRVKGFSAQQDIALVFGYACHCTILSFQKFSGDYAGAAQAFLESRHPGAVAMFMNGCSGDQNPYPRRDPDLVEDHGRSLALAVETALETPPRQVTGAITTAFREIDLPFETLPTRSELETRAKSSNKLDAGLASHLLERLDRGEKLETSYPYPVQVIRLGNDITLIALAGEVVVDYSLRLQKEIEDPVVWVAGYSNDVMTYIPSRRIWKEGGYEGADAMKHNLFPARWSPDIEEQIISTVHELRRSLK